MACKLCSNSAVVIRSHLKLQLCKICFNFSVENDVYRFLHENNIRDRKAILCVSGGKDSTVLLHIMHILNKRHALNLDIELLSIDEGIKYYRTESLRIVQNYSSTYHLPLKIISFKEKYEKTMDEIVKSRGDQNNCTICGTFRRRIFDEAVKISNGAFIMLGHNADDIAETVILNYLRNDFNRFKSMAGGDSNRQKIKPLKYLYEKDIVMYAFHNKLPYFATECTYAPTSTRGLVRVYLKKLERIDPTIILKINEKIENLKFDRISPTLFNCNLCTMLSSNRVCRACIMKSEINKN